MSTPLQAFASPLGHIASPDGIEQVTPGRKPRNGLWTSDWDGVTSPWLDLLQRDHDLGDLQGFHPRSLTTVTLLTPDPAARIYTVDSAADLDALFARFPRHADFGETVDWVVVGEHYDAVRLTYAGQQATPLRTDKVDTYGWDIPSTVWYRWCFTSVEVVTWRAAQTAESLTAVG